MKAVHVLRKPCSESTVAANVLRWGTGALNVDECRIGNGGGTSRTGQAAYPKNTDGSEDRSKSWARTGHGILTLNAGRWPANLVLQHLDGCVQDGVKKVKGQNPKYANEGRGAGKGEGVYESGVGPRPAGIGIGYSDPDGTETVTAWTCVEGCPVAALDAQSGFLVARGNKTSMGHGPGSGSGVTGWGKGRADAPPRLDLNDGGGGASRFFKQVGGRSE